MEDQQPLDQHKNEPLQVNTNMGSNSALMKPQNTSKLLQLNQNRFEDYLVQALNESLMKKSKYPYLTVIILQMTSNVSDLSLGGLRIGRGIRYLSFIDLMESHMRLLLRIPSIMSRRFTQGSARSKDKLSSAGTFMLDAMSTYSESQPFWSNVI